jgi:hypothetical protein
LACSKAWARQTRLCKQQQQAILWPLVFQQSSSSGERQHSAKSLRPWHHLQCRQLLLCRVLCLQELVAAICLAQRSDQMAVVVEVLLALGLERQQQQQSLTFSSRLLQEDKAPPAAPSPILIVDIQVC